MAAHNNKRQIICNLGLRKKKCIHFACLERFHQNKHSRILLTGGEADADAKTFWRGWNCTILCGSAAARLLPAAIRYFIPETRRTGETKQTQENSTAPHHKGPCPWSNTVTPTRGQGRMAATQVCHRVNGSRCWKPLYLGEHIISRTLGFYG